MNSTLLSFDNFISLMALTKSWTFWWYSHLSVSFYNVVKRGIYLLGLYENVKTFTRIMCVSYGALVDYTRFAYLDGFRGILMLWMNFSGFGVHDNPAPRRHANDDDFTFLWKGRRLNGVLKVLPRFKYSWCEWKNYAIYQRPEAVACDWSTSVIVDAREIN